MKKFLVMLLVLGLSSMANAALKFNDQGPGNLSIESDAPFTAADNTYVWVVSDGVTPTGGALTAGAPPNSTWFGDSSSSGMDDVIAGLLGKAAGTVTGVWGSYAETTGETAAAIYTDGITMGAEAWLFGSVDFANFTELDYIPEPMTMSLLGLGGLALLRRRR
jgi:hypothetical protein